jgi:hypothetical protein
MNANDITDALAHGKVLKAACKEHQGAILDHISLHIEGGLGVCDTHLTDEAIRLK